MLRELGEADGLREAVLRDVEVLAGERHQALPRDAVGLPGGVALGPAEAQRLVHAGALASRSPCAKVIAAWVSSAPMRTGGAIGVAKAGALGVPPADEQVAAQPPVEPQRPAQAAGDLAVAVRQAGLERGLEVALLARGRRERVHGPGAPVGRHLVLREGQEGAGVRRS